ncbi:fused toes isoform 1-like protein [Camelus ferus]|nr:fused toes isoform 1-like protein [Camelus ferus]
MTQLLATKGAQIVSPVTAFLNKGHSPVARDREEWLSGDRSQKGQCSLRVSVLIFPRVRTTVFPHQGPQSSGVRVGGKFRSRLVFDIPVFHPLVDPTSGELDVKRAFAKWRRNHNHIWQVLMYARRVFYKIDTASPLNPEAAVLYEKDVQLFKSKVVDSVKVCTARLFDQPKIDDPYAISFSPWNPSVHDEAREKMLTQKKKPEEQHNKSVHVAGLSWVKPGSVQPFSKEEKTVAT